MKEQIVSSSVVVCESLLICYKLKTLLVPGGAYVIQYHLAGTIERLEAKLVAKDIQYGVDFGNSFSCESPQFCSYLISLVANLVGNYISWM